MGNSAESEGETEVSSGSLFGSGSTVNFPSSVLALITWAFSAYVASCFLLLSTPICGSLSFIVGILVHHWYWLHGVKLSRKSMIFFDESNLLETSNLFEYNYGPNVEGTTPISGPEKNPDAPTTLWQALFCDDKELQIQKEKKLISFFYQDREEGW
ncbi:hypothetical protein Q1695_003841 [Nippostrongylus brasiliensis]|nr:hypothetical protein Q1695_003841 [Nippostrongylus brasiliensis]